MNSPHMAKQRELAQLLSLLRPAIQEKKVELAQLFAALALLALTQSLFLILIGPLFKAAFDDLGPSASIALGNLFPKQMAMYFPRLANYEVSRTMLSEYLPLSLVLVALSKSLATYFFQYKQSYLSLHLGMRYREKVFAAIIRQNFDTLAAKSPAAWMSLVMHDVQFLQARLSDLFGGFIRDGSVVVSSLVALYVIHWQTGVVVTMLAVPLTLSAGRTGRKIAGYAERWQAELARLAAAVLDFRRRFEFIRAQVGEEFEFKNFQKLNNNYYQMVKKSIFLRSAFAPGLEFAGFVFFALVIYCISQGFLGQDFGAGELLQFFAALGILLRPLKSIGEQLSRYHETMGILRSSLETFDKVARQNEHGEVAPALPVPPKPSFALKAIELQYGDGFRLVAEHLKISPGRSVCLIGPSGAGKSTLLKALAGLYQPRTWQGEPSWASTVLAGNLVSQHPFLFSGTLRDNLCYGLETAPSDRDMEEALDFVDIKRELQDKGMSLDSPLDFIMSPLSGGQLQRLTIARALLRPQSLLLLDEVTAAIDPLAEEIFIERLLGRVRTQALALLFVTHRLKHIHLFDEVWFCESGLLTAYQGEEWTQSERVQSFLTANLIETT